MSTHAAVQKRQHEESAPQNTRPGKSSQATGVGLPLFMQANPTASAGGTLQRKCACDGIPGANDECETCNNGKPLQAKLAIGASDDPLEHEADRVADQVLAKPAHSNVSTTLPRIQRYTRQKTEGTDTAPDSVARVLSSSGRPLEPTLQQDMEQRFGHDFSRVRVHSGSEAEQSAREVQARAYAVGQQIVFAPGEYAPHTLGGRRLLAHELAHTVQQSGGATPAIARQPDPAFAVNQQDMVSLQNTMLSFYNLLTANERGSLQRNTTVVIALVTYANKPYLIYTVASNSTNPGIRAAADRLGLTRWDPEGIDKVAGERHAEQLTVETASKLRFKVHGIAVTRKPCVDCGPVIAEKGIPIVWVRDPNPAPRTPGTPGGPPAGGILPPPPRPPSQLPDPAKTTVASGGSGASGAGGAGSTGARPTYAGRGAIVAPIVTGGPSPAKVAAANGLAELAQFGNRVLGHFADETQAGLAQAKIEMHLKSIASFWERSPKQGVLLSITWEVTHYAAGDVRKFVNVKVRHGLTQAIARRTNANMLVEEPNAKLDVQGDEIWIEPPSPEAVHNLPAPFPKIALATFARRDEVQDVKWKGVATFDDDGFTSLKPVPGGIANFFILQPPSELTFMNGRMRQTTSVPILHRSAPNGWTIPVVNLDTVVGYIPFVDRDTAAMVVPANTYTAALFKESPEVGAASSQLRLYDFANVRFVSPSNIEVLKSLSESDMPTPKHTAKMTPQDWADMSVAVQGHEARELWNRITTRGRRKVRPEFVREFMTLLPADLTMAEVDILSADPGVQRADLSEDALLEAWRDAIARLREKPAAGVAATDDALKKLIVDKLAKSNWTGVPADAIYFQSEVDPEKGPVGLEVGTRVNSFCYGTAKGTRYGALVTLTVGGEADGRTPVTVDEVRSPIVDTHGIVLAGASHLLGKTFRISPRKTLATKAEPKSASAPGTGDAKKP